MTYARKLMHVSLFIIITVLVFKTDAYNILAIFPHTGKSHFTVFNPLMLELARRGHNVTVVSHFPESKPPKGYNPVSVYGSKPTQLKKLNVTNYGNTWSHSLTSVLAYSRMGKMNCLKILNSSQIRDRLTESYDLAIVEQFTTECFLTVPYLLKIPHISISSCNIMGYYNNRNGLVDNPSYIPHSLLFYSDKMNFLERFENTIAGFIINNILAPILITREGTRITRNFYGDDIPHLSELAKSTSLVLVNTYAPLNRPKPLPPNVKEIGGIHVPPVKPLPKDLQSFLDESEHGAIYFSLGSMLQVSSFPSDKMKIFTDVFAELPQRILWKFENDSLPVYLENVITRKWFPQNDILYHPKVITFISHCGMGSTIEAVTQGVPLICMPFFGDQHANAATVTESGGGIKLNFKELTKDDLRNALKKTLSLEFQKQVKKLSEYYNDRPMSPMDTAVYWVEYVARHKGAEHLKPQSIHMNFIEYYLIDIGCAIIVTICLIVYIVRKIKCLFMKIVYNKTKTSQIKLKKS